MKKCSKCDKEKSILEFHKDKNSKDGLTYYCRDCQNNRTKKYNSKHPELRLLAIAKYRAKKRGKNFAITKTDIVIPSYCPVLGIPLQRSENIYSNDSPSLDCIRPELGYIPDNIAVISHRANRIKQDATLEELKSLTTWLEQVPILQEHKSILLKREIL